ncbi:MAG: squalene/phytoene synthase family protein [Elusimicrobia bacterium]|nr:squalene/phytoene synthase family protein [Elusimicrobiota bacterium]
MEKHGAAALSGEIKTILKKVSRTLYLSVAVLPEPVRTCMGLGYLLCRALDTAVDTSGIPAQEKLKILSLARAINDPGSREALLHKIRALSEFPAPQGERELLLKFGKVLDIFAALPEEDKPLFTDLLGGIASGMEMDVRSFPGGAPAALPRASDLERYCALIGGVPGIFWARLYRQAIRRSTRGGFLSEKDAEMIGAALQMTNILKDMAADLANGRCYIPQEDLDTRNMKPGDLLDKANMGRLREIVLKWVMWAVDRLDQSEAFVSAIPKTEAALRAATIWPIYWSMDTLEEVVRSNLLDSAERPKVGRLRIYGTIAATPPLLLSNTAFARGYRFRRETLIGAITGGNYEGRSL